MSCALSERRRQPGMRTLYGRHAQAAEPDVGVVGRLGEASPSSVLRNQ